MADVARIARTFSLDKHQLLERLAVERVKLVNVARIDDLHSFLRG